MFDARKPFGSVSGAVLSDMGLCRSRFTRRAFVAWMIAAIVVFTLSSLTDVVAIPPSIPAHLYVKKVLSSSEDFHFVDPHAKDAKYEAGEGFPSSRYRDFCFSGSPTNLRISVNGKELLSVPVASLPSEVKPYKDQSGQWRETAVYRFPRGGFRGSLYDTGKRLSHFEDAKVEIFLDDKLVRAFVMDYRPGEIFKGPSRSLNRVRIVLYILLPALALGAVVIGLVLRHVIRRRREKEPS